MKKEFYDGILVYRITKILMFNTQTVDVSKFELLIIIVQLFIFKKMQYANKNTLKLNI